MTVSLIFYTTAGCHLCEQAESILEAAGIRFTPVDIEEDLELIKRYGIRIPVVADAEGRELGWPFDGRSVLHWLSESA